MGEGSQAGSHRSKPKYVESYPYPVVDGIPTYETDNGMLGQKALSSKRLGALEQKAKDKSDAISDKLLHLSKSPKEKKQKPKIRKQKDPMRKPSLRTMRDALGNAVPRPPLSRSTSVGAIEGIYFTGINHSQPEMRTLANFKKGLRLSACWDNVASYGSDSWHTTNGEFGSVVQPSVLGLPRAGLISFELLRFLPHHPHWKDRPVKPPANMTTDESNKKRWWTKIATPPSTYMDLGEWYAANEMGLPGGYEYIPRRIQPDQVIPFGPTSLNMRTL